MKTANPINLFLREPQDPDKAGSGAQTPDPNRPESAGLKGRHLEIIRLLATLHKRFLDEIKSELDRLGIDDVNNTQTLLLVHIGDENPTISELIHRGYYVGSNISYNVKKLIENGYLIAERSIHDRRSTRVRLSAQARHLVEVIDPLFEQHGHPFQPSDPDCQVMTGVIDKLRMLERIWPRGGGYPGHWSAAKPLGAPDNQQEKGAS